MEHVDQSSMETFQFSLGSKVLLWFSELFLVMLSISMFFFEPSNPDARWSTVMFGIAFGLMALAMIPTLRRLPGKIHVDSQSIAYESPSGDQKLLPWNQINSVVDFPLAQRIEVRGNDGFPTIRIENQISRCERLLEIVLDRSNWLELEIAESPPVTFRRTTSTLVMLCICVMVFSGIGIALDPAGIVFLFFGLGWALLEWISLRVTHEGVEIQHLMWKRTIPFERIKAVRLEPYRPRGHAFFTVMLDLQHGGSKRIHAVQEGSLKLYKTLKSLLESEREVNRNSEEL